MVSLKVQKYIVLIPYGGFIFVFIVATINLFKELKFAKAWIMLCLVSNPYIFVFGFFYVMAFIYNISPILVIIIFYLIHVITGYMLIAIQARLLNKNIIEEENKCKEREK